jgi:hypothetical protein
LFDLAYASKQSSNFGSNRALHTPTKQGAAIKRSNVKNTLRFGADIFDQCETHENKGKDSSNHAALKFKRRHTPAFSSRCIDPNTISQRRFEREKQRLHRVFATENIRELGVTHV